MNCFLLSVSYAQIAVFHADLENPFNGWTERHVAQGFSWRPRSVAFKTLLESGPTSVEVRTADAAPPPSGVRAISVPFDCPEAGTVEVASIFDGRICAVPPGACQLLFETGDSDAGNWCRFTFVRNGPRTPRILRSDAEVVPSHSLFMHAEPA